MNINLGSSAHVFSLYFSKKSHEKLNSKHQHVKMPSRNKRRGVFDKYFDFLLWETRRVFSDIFISSSQPLSLVCMSRREWIEREMKEKFFILIFTFLKRVEIEKGAKSVKKVFLFVLLNYWSISLAHFFSWKVLSDKREVGEEQRSAKFTNGWF